MEGGTTLGGPPSLVKTTNLPTQAKKKRKNKKPAAKAANGAAPPASKPIVKEKEAPKKKAPVKKVIEESSSSDDDSSEEDYSDDEDEGKEGYKKGGYHPVNIGETYNKRYLVIEKLGWGHFSTVWLCTDNRRKGAHVALKIVKSAKHYTEAANDEIKILRIIAEGNKDDTQCCVNLLDSFEHKGPHGKHVCMVFEVLGSNLLDLIKAFNYRGVPLPVVKSISKQVLIGLDYLHTHCKVIHTDLKPENVLLHYTLPKTTKRKRDKDEADEEDKNGKDAQNGKDDDESDQSEDEKPKDDPEDSDEDEEKEENKENKNPDTKKKVVNAISDLKLADHGTDSQDSQEPQSPQEDSQPSQGSQTSHIKYRMVDVHDSDSYRSKIADFGNACWVHEHFTNDIQTRQYRAPEVILGCKYSASVDMWSMACLVFELATGDLLFEPKSGSSFDKNDDHLGQMVELLGKMPKMFTFDGKHSKDYFNKKGELRYIRSLNMWSLPEILMEKYHWEESDAKEMSDFLHQMLKYQPDKRATAKQCLDHPWVKDAPPMMGGAQVLSPEEEDKTSSSQE
eukprot:TRINITY_DN2756_c0_g1_i1.p1 TRINITY_DN2756_c0_g1~~TRINITY_DN2756_c0_g1_i1.p1  ORF type:complete len:583 (-),score=144.95 TRINITY_DN2756_c0_g1_i1:94-1782(-)